MKALPLALALMLGATAADAHPRDPGAWTPTPEMVARLEAQVSVPAGAGDFHKALRVYWGETQKGRRIVVGQYHMRADQSSIQIVDADHQPMMVFDGGCSFVMVWYDAEGGRVLRSGCNGVA